MKAVFTTNAVPTLIPYSATKRCTWYLAFDLKGRPQGGDPLMCCQVDAHARKLFIGLNGNRFYDHPETYLYRPLKAPDITLEFTF